MIGKKQSKSTLKKIIIVAASIAAVGLIISVLFLLNLPAPM